MAGCQRGKSHLAGRPCKYKLYYSICNSRGTARRQVVQRPASRRRYPCGLLYRRAALVRSVHPRGAAYCNCGYGGTTGWPTSRLCLVLLCCICVDKYNIHLLIQVSVTVRGIRGVSPEEGKEGYGGNTMFNVAKLLCVVCRLKNIPIKDDTVAEN